MRFSQLVHGEGYIVGDVKWNSSGKALSEDQIRETYTIGEEKKSAGAFSSYIKGKHGESVNDLSNIHTHVLLTFQGTLKSNGEKVGMKLEDPKETECYLPLEVQVYEDLEKSKVRYLIRPHSIIQNSFLLQKHRWGTFWKKVLQTFTVMACLRRKEY